VDLILLAEPITGAVSLTLVLIVFFVVERGEVQPNGMITPSGLHYERSHSGIPDINPDAHRVVIHGLVKRPLVFTLDDIARYPLQSRIAFVECAQGAWRKSQT
jgi:DMSO/TMAO reductase YedYZ molybdopterin-dependent catalytic subunit